LNTVIDKRGWIGSLYQRIFFGDLVSRYQIRNDFALRVLIRKLAESVKQPLSFNRLSNLVSAAGKKISTDTVIDYLGYLKDTWLLFPMENIVAKLADKESNKKYYFIDNGLLNLFLVDPNTALLENQVAIGLRKRFGADVYYFLNQVEVDFYVPEERLAIQVCYSMQDESTSKREIGALLKMNNLLEVETRMIITKDDEMELEEQGRKIFVVPAWKWLLNQDKY
jgi:predicted AAA+ superfamily ATPase